jgi:flagella basal body P-ring formation protein FlgA
MLPIEILVDGEPVRMLWITADVRIRACVLQAARRLPYGAVLGAGDLRETLADIRDPRASYIRQVEEAAGKVTRRVLMPGDLLVRDALSDPLAVRNGDTVRVLLNRADIRLVVLARAEQDGRLGQMIRVRNVDFASVLNGRVSGRGEVTIQ